MIGSARSFIAARSIRHIPRGILASVSTPYYDVDHKLQRHENELSVRRRRLFSTSATTTASIADTNSAISRKENGEENKHEEFYGFISNGQLEEALSVFRDIDRDVVDDDSVKVLSSALLDAFLDQHKRQIDSFLLLNTRSRRGPSIGAVREINENQLQNVKNFLEWSKNCHALLETTEPLVGIRHNWYGESFNGDNASERSMQPNKQLSLTCERVLEAWAKSLQAVALFRTHGFTPDALKGVVPMGLPQRTSFLFTKMLDLDGVTVSSAALNHCIDVWGNSFNEHHRGTNAERFFRDSTKRREVPFNMDSLRLLIRAWCMSGERKAAFTSSGHMHQILRNLQLEFNRSNSGDRMSLQDDEKSTENNTSQANPKSGEMDLSDMQEPTLEEYHMILKAWTTSFERTSPSKCHFIVKSMNRFYRKGITMVKPDVLCHRYLLQVFANRPTQLFDYDVDDIFGEMKLDMLVPDSDCYTYAIKIQKNNALHVEDEIQDDKERHVSAAIKFLNEIEIANQRQMLTDVTARTENINDVIEALTASLKEDRLEKALKLLGRLENSIGDGNTLLYPNTDSYIFTLHVIASFDKMSDRVEKSKEILARFIGNIASIESESKQQRQEIVRVFDEFMLVCSKHEPSSTQNGMAVIGEALSAVETLRGLMCGTIFRPAPSTFSALLEVCGALMDTAGPPRDALLTKVFDLCKNECLVNGEVIVSLKKHASTDLFYKLVVSKCEVVEEMKLVPEAWTVNILGGSIIGVDGRKTIPLSIEGTTHRTMAMKEFLMRKLRDGRNRKLLQGGRMDRSKPYLSPFRLYDDEGRPISTPPFGIVSLASIVNGNKSQET